MQSTKPDKPYPEYPLFAHANGQWAKKIQGHLYYFGVWDDPNGALNRYLDQVDEIQAGRVPRARSDAVTVAQLCDMFMVHKDRLQKAGDITQRTRDRYYATCEVVVKHLGRSTAVSSLRSHHFERLRERLAETWGPVGLGNEIQTVRSIFRYGYESELLDKPVRFGPGFMKPSAKTIRQARAAKGPRMFSSDEIRVILDHATLNMKAMVLLGINAGLGNTDLGLLPIAAVNLNAGWMTYPRTKTGIIRKVPLWPETVQAIRDMKEKRREPKDPESAKLLFIGKHGTDYVGDHRGYRVTQEFDRVAEKAKVQGRTFYDLRRTFQTIAEGCGDLPAVKAIMGHAPDSGDMSAVYRQLVSDDRLKKVTDHVHRWLFSK